MADASKTKLSPVSIAIDLVLCVIAFVIFYKISNAHVASNDPKDIAIWSAFTATCMTGVFWLAWQMLKAVYRFQREGSGQRD